MRISGVASLLAVLLFFSACKNDDDLDITTVPPRLLSEVAAEDDAEIQQYLQTHFYNYEEFENPPAGFDFKIVIDTIAGENADKEPLSTFAKSMDISVSSDDFSLSTEETVTHTLYYISARAWDDEAPRPTQADSTLLKYEGSLLDGTLFDATSSFSWQYLPFFLRGYANAVSQFVPGNDIVVNPDGTTSISNSGIGVMFLPSGLAYFNASVVGVPQYSPLIFKVEVGLFVPDTDYDNDGIPSILEDLDGDGDLRNDNTDREQEQAVGSPFFANHVDSDDDADGTPTREEISDENGNIIMPYPDSDGDGTPDYLDPNVN